MKHRLPTNSDQNTTKRIRVAVILVLLVGGMVIGRFAPFVNADKWDEQIRILQNENQQYAARASELRAYAGTLAEEVARLEAERAAIQAQIDASVARVNELKQQIKVTEQKIDNTREALGEVITEIYLAGQISPLERLASQKSLTEYLDEEAAREELQHELNRSVKEIDTYKKQLENKQKDVERVLEDQRSQEAVLSAKKQEQANLLAQTQGEEANYRRLADDNNARIRELRAEQIAYIASLGGKAVPGDPNKGGYPSNLANAYWNPYLGYSTVVDPWGMYARQCVSYAAWKVHENYGNMPYWGGIGNANQWYGNAGRFGIPRGTTAKPGSVGISLSGYYGHAVWVEAVVGNDVIVSEYNFDWAGNYRRARYPASSFVYIYFGEWK